MAKTKRIAFYGGTFDPVHRAHLDIARSVSRLFELDQFVFVPAKRAPHKIGQEVTSAFHRHAMLALATRDNATLCVSTFELERPERQYTVDTLSHHRERLGQSADLLFVMGADSWSEITTWHQWQRLMDLAALIVVTRPGFDIKLDDTTGGEVIDVRGAQSFGFVGELGVRKVYVTDAVSVDISATAVRATAREGNHEKLTAMVPPEVADYIRKYGLYRNTNEA